MNFRDFSSIMQQKGLRVVGREAYGLVGNYPVSARLNNGKSGNMVQVAFALRPDQAKESQSIPSAAVIPCTRALPRPESGP